MPKNQQQGKGKKNFMWSPTDKMAPNDAIPGIHTLCSPVPHVGLISVTSRT